MAGEAEVLVVGRPLGWATLPHLRPEASHSSKLAVVVPFTDTYGTLAAMRMAGRLSQDLDAQINLVAFQVVPYKLELKRPAIAIACLEERLRALASDLAVPMHVDIILCRDARWALQQLLMPHSLVVMGTRRRWWRTKEQRLAERLRHDGHRVILACLQ